MLNERSEKALVGVHPALVAVVRAGAARFAKEHPGLGVIVTEGRRTSARQAQLLAAGASQTMNSRHLTGHAVDFAVTLNGKVRWDWPLYSKLGASVKAAAADLGTPIVWGGDWRTLRDGPHFELDRRSFPV